MDTRTTSKWTPATTWTGSCRSTWVRRAHGPQPELSGATCTAANPKWPRHDATPVLFSTQADDDESAAATAAADLGAGEGAAVSPQRSLAEQTGSYRGHDDGEAAEPGEGAPSTYGSPAVQVFRPHEQDSAGPTPQAERSSASASPPMAQASSSPLSPPVPPLPPLNQTVSPYLARNPSYHSEASSAAAPQRAPAVSHDPTPASAVSFAAHIPTAAATAAAGTPGAGGVPPRPGTSRGAGSQSAAAAIQSRPTTASTAPRSQAPAPAGYNQQQQHPQHQQQYAASADAAGAMPALSLALLQQASQSDAAVQQQQQLAAAIRQSVDVLRASEQVGGHVCDAA